MITRRSFLSALASLPLVGKLIPQEYYSIPMAFVCEEMTTAEFSELFDHDNFESAFSDRIDEVGREIERLLPQIYSEPKLTFAEWDRKYQQGQL